MIKNLAFFVTVPSMYILECVRENCSNRWFSWGMASLLEDKSQVLCLVQLCKKCRLVNLC